MDTTLLWLLLFGLIAAGANILGALVLFPSIRGEGPKRSLKYFLALGAGFMLAVTFFEIVPKSIEAWQKVNPGSPGNLYPPMLLLLAGYLLTQFFEHTVAPHFHLGEEEYGTEHITVRSAYSGVGGLLVHTFFDGISVAAASQIDLNVGLLVFVAVFLHKFPEGFTIGSIMVAAGKGRQAVLLAAALLGAMTAVGMLFFHLVGVQLGFTAAYALPLASGVTLYVAASDLVPEVNHHGGRRTMASLAIFAGAALFFLCSYTLHEVIAH
jgi:zinc transporter ZupT